VQDNVNNGSLCADYGNAATALTLSYDKNEIFYKSSDGNLWYCYNDFENTSQPGNSAITVSAPNWNKSCITCSTGMTVNDYISVEQTQNGKIFYTANTNGQHHMAGSGWVPADNPINCPNINGGSNTAGTYNLRMDTLPHTNDSLSNQASSDTSGITSISVFPNPGENLFNFILTNANGPMNLVITDIEGRPVFNYKEQYSTSHSQRSYAVVWNADQVAKGIYYYNMNMNGTPFTGKIIKIQ
jgi:hypothetical protein